MSFIDFFCCGKASIENSLRLSEIGSEKVDRDSLKPPTESSFEKTRMSSNHHFLLNYDSIEIEKSEPSIIAKSEKASLSLKPQEKLSVESPNALLITDDVSVERTSTTALCTLKVENPDNGIKSQGNSPKDNQFPSDLTLGFFENKDAI